MAEGNFGGGGSVRWAVNVDDDEREDPRKKTKFTERAKGCRARGVDKVHDSHFIVTLNVPGIDSQNDFVKWLRDDKQGNLTVRGGMATFRLLIDHNDNGNDEDDPKQICVRWK
jgi:hypothetical protein